MRLSSGRLASGKLSQRILPHRRLDLIPGMGDFLRLKMKTPMVLS